MTEQSRSSLLRITEAKLSDEDLVLDALMAEHPICQDVRDAAVRDASALVQCIRGSRRTNLTDSLLVEFGLSSSAGLSLLRLIEALMRVPDTETVNRLIRDKLGSIDWGGNRNPKTPALVKAVKLSLALTAYCLSPHSSSASAPRRVLNSAAMPIVRFCVRCAAKFAGNRFVHASTIEQAIKKSASMERQGYAYSYDMLGEAALTEAEASRYFDDYKNAVKSLQPRCLDTDFRRNPGISIKLSALHPRYELTQRDRVISELVEKVTILARMAKSANIGVNVDAEEADRLELSLELIERVLRDPELQGWNGFGIVVQAYGKAAPSVLDYLYELAGALDRKIMIRLVKGAYWDSEIKRAQVEGLADFPVFTRKSSTDVSYLCCAKKLLGMTDRIYPQFASHNAHTVAAILAMTDNDTPFEFQRVHGMGEALYAEILERKNRLCRIYAPIGRHRELLPYLARRMLENGANTSFVNQIADPRCAVSEVAADPFEKLTAERNSNSQPVRNPRHLFGAKRLNSKGWDLHNPEVLQNLDHRRSSYRTTQWPGPTGRSQEADETTVTIMNPADLSDVVGYRRESTEADVQNALVRATAWNSASGKERGNILTRISELFEERAGEFVALLCRESGKTLDDATAEIREAVDFLRYYAVQADESENQEPVGVVACISPWNFPLAIFTGQIAGALSAGNCVLAKPAPQTSIIANAAVALMHEAGVPDNVVQLLPGMGPKVGKMLVSDPRVAAVAFTGSTETASLIDREMAASLEPTARLVAETGGLNAMIADSTALPEQVVMDVIASAFRSAGQRCSAIRILYVQDEVFDQIKEMLFGAMDQLSIGDPWNIETDVGPLIDKTARDRISAYVESARRQGRLLKQCDAPSEGYFVGPAVISAAGIEDLQEEIFGPVLHLARYAEKDFSKIIEAINESDYGLTFGLHSRIDARIAEASDLKVGNIYINRNQIGAVVGSQPFGGERLSGTGPKAGGPKFIDAFRRAAPQYNGRPAGDTVDAKRVQTLLDRARSNVKEEFQLLDLPGPTGETNHLKFFPCGTVLCLGPTADDAAEQAAMAVGAGCAAVCIADGASGELSCSGMLNRESLRVLENFDAVVLWSDREDLRLARNALASRTGPLIPLIAAKDFTERLRIERHVCIDTTAAGGNAALYAEVAAGLQQS